ncbi:MAG: HAMP domain-containing histidine kinase [Myxococcales bacterium]|nr:HAMP domain-containing histidine kinase [Myxococcales bacterium]
MPAPPNTRPLPSLRRRFGHAITTRVFIGTTVIVLAFSGLVSYAIYLYRQSTREMALLNVTYIPLTMGVSEVAATQVVFNTLMDRLADDPAQPLTRDWLNAARRYRPAVLFQLTQLIHNTLRQDTDISEEERVFLKDIQGRLSDVRTRYRANEAHFTALFGTLDTGQRDEVLQQIERLKRSERLLNKVLASIGTDVKQHITRVSVDAVAKANNATLFLGIASVLLLLLGIALIISTSRLLAPLKKLQAAVTRVTAGELDTNIRIFRDDEIGALTQSFNAMTQALIARDQTLIRHEQLATAGKIAAQVTHEIRNPLFSLGLNADLLKEEIQLREVGGEAQALLAAMTDEVERLTGITESYLQFARLPAPSPRFTDPVQFVESAVAFMKGEISEAGISVAVDIAPHMPQWLFDKGQVRQALVNLIRNATEAIGESEHGHIRICAAIDNAELVIRVCDNGPGIPEEVRARIFEPFFTTKSTGSGQGLAMVRQICRAHGGRIQCETTPNRETAFAMYFPASATSPIEVSHADANEP